MRLTKENDSMSTKSWMNYEPWAKGFNLKSRSGRVYHPYTEKDFFKKNPISTNGTPTITK